jgi:hypothetical protein
MRSLLACLLVIGCTTDPTKIGTRCKATANCNVAGQVCAPGISGGPSICTHPCANNLECPAGYDCTKTDPALSKTCNKTLYATDKKTGDPLLFGKPCGPGDDTLCQGTGDPNPNPTCRKGNNPNEAKAVVLDQDPNAYCTGSCNSDGDCPLPMKCAVDFDGVQKCLKRNVCDPCSYDENCGYDSGVFRSDFTACVPTKDGTANYCSKPCNSDGDCPGAAKKSKWMVCQPTTDTDGNQGNFCLHWYGACVGKGEICDPCRTDADCAMSSTKCIDNPYFLYSYPFTGERMCNHRCKADTDCGGPNLTTCDNSDPPTQANPYGMSILICIPNARTHVGVFACHN